MKQLIVIILWAISLIACSQVSDTGIYVEYGPGFYERVIMADREKADESVPKKRFRAGLSDLEFPTDTGLYTPYWHQKPVSQGATGTCWSYATISFLESEV